MYFKLTFTNSAIKFFNIFVYFYLIFSEDLLKFSTTIYLLLFILQLWHLLPHIFWDTWCVYIRVCVWLLFWLYSISHQFIAAIVIYHIFALIFASIYNIVFLSHFFPFLSFIGWVHYSVAMKIMHSVLIFLVVPLTYWKSFLCLCISNDYLIYEIKCS